MQLSLIWYQNTNINSEVRHLHNTDSCIVYYEVVPYETCLENNSCTNSENQHLPFFVDDTLLC